LVGTVKSTRVVASPTSLCHQLIAKVVLLDYSHDEAADLLGCRRRTVGRLYPEAVDHLSEIFLHGGLLELIVDPESEPEDEDEGYVASTN